MDANLKLLTWTVLESSKCCIKVHYLISQKCRYHKILFTFFWRPRLRLSKACCVDHLFSRNPTLSQHSLSSNLFFDPFLQIAGHQPTPWKSTWMVHMQTQ